MSKIKVMIAEDEIAIAHLIHSLIDFERLDLEFTNFAHDGLTAWNLLEEDMPDILISDISMPLMSGLELIEKAKEASLPVHIIIISGMTSFQYAVSAIKMGVEDYLIKPVNRIELNDVLEKTILKIAETRRIDYQIRHLGIDLNANNRRLRQSLIMNILYNKELSAYLSVTDCNRDYHFSFQESGSFLMGIVHIDDMMMLNLAEQSSLISQLMRIFDTALREICCDLETYEKNNQFIFLLNYLPNNEYRIFGTMDALRDEFASLLMSYQTLAPSIAVGVPVEFPGDLITSMNSAFQVLNARLLTGLGRLFFAAELIDKDAKPSFLLTTSDMTALHSCVEIRDAGKFEETLTSLLRSAAESCLPYPYLIMDLYRDLISGLLSDFYRHQLIRENITDLYLQYCDIIESCTTLDALVSCTCNFMKDQFDFRQPDTDPENRQIEFAKKYILEHFNENLRLEDVAEQVYLAPTYFGVLFKKEVGESFSSYLTSTRIEKAKELLHNLKYNVAEVAYAVGYHDKRYFSRLFREHVGVTPKEYRKIYAS